MRAIGPAVERAPPSIYLFQHTKRVTNPSCRTRAHLPNFLAPGTADQEVNDFLLRHDLALRVTAARVHRRPSAKPPCRARSRPRRDALNSRPLSLLVRVPVDPKTTPARSPHPNQPLRRPKRA